MRRVVPPIALLLSLLSMLAIVVGAPAARATDEEEQARVAQRNACHLRR